MLQMASMFRDPGSPFAANSFGGAGAGTGGFPAPGNPGGTTATATPGSPPSQTSGSATGAPAPFNMFGGPAPGAGAGAGSGAAGGVPANPFGAVDPALMQQMFGGFGAGNGFGGMGAGGFGGASAAPTTPADTRSPEERFQVQLQVSLSALYGLVVGRSSFLTTFISFPCFRTSSSLLAISDA